MEAFISKIVHQMNVKGDKLGWDVSQQRIEKGLK